MAVAFPFSDIDELINVFARHDEFLSRLAKADHERSGGFTIIDGEPRAEWCVLYHCFVV
jgi:hypothetical protein